MSLKSIGNVSAILKEIAVSGSISKATFDSLNLSLQGLNEAQIAATVSLSGLSAEQVASSLKASGFTATQTAATMATLQFSEQATMAAMSAAGFEKAQIKDAIAATTFTAAETAATAATGGLSAAMSGLTAVMAANPFMIAVTAISILIAAIPMAINFFNSLHKTTEELKQEYDDLTSELDGLNSELKTTKDRIAELQKLSDEGTITLVEQEELDRLLETNAQLERQIRLKNEAAQEAADKSNKSLVKDYNNEYYNSNAGMYILSDADAIRANNAEGFKALEEWHNGWSENWDKFSEEEQERLINLYSEYQNLMLEGNNKLQFPEQLGFDDYVDQLIVRYKELEDLGQDATDSQIAEIASIRSELLSLNQTLQNDYIDNFVGDGEDVKNWNNLADAIDACINPAEHFTSLLNNLPTGLKNALSSGGANGELTAERVNELAGQYQELAKWMEDSGYTADELASHYNSLRAETDNGTKSTAQYVAQLSDFAETLSELQSAYDVIATAEKEMVENGGLSADTIADLAEAEANYLDYLYEENGVIKLNIKAWKDRTSAKAQDKISALKNNLNVLRAESAQLRTNIKYYDEQRKIGNDGGIWSNLIREATADLAKNEEAIKSHEKELGIWEAAISGVTDRLNDFVASLSRLDIASGGVENISKVLDTFKNDGRVAASDLSDLVDVFGNLNSFEDFVRIMSDSSSTMKEAQDACNELAAEYINTLGILDGLNEETATMVEQELSAMGVTNAHEIVQTRLNAIRLEAILTAKNQADAEWEAAEKTLLESGAAETAIASLKRLRQEQYNAKLAAVDFVDANSDVITGLISQAKAAGVAAESIHALSMIQMIKNTLDNANLPDNVREIYQEQIEHWREKAQTDLSDFGSITLPQVKVSLPKSSSKGSSGSNSNSKSETEFERLYKYHQHLLAMDQEQISDYLQWLDSAYKAAYEKGEIELDDYYKYEEEVFEKIKSILDDVRKEHENAITLNENWLNNAIDDKDFEGITKYTSEIINHYKAMQEEVHKQAEYYRSLGYSDTSDEVSKLSDLWWDYYDAIAETSANAWQQVVDNANDAVDEITGLYDTLKDAAQEYADSGFITIDTLQEICSWGIQYLAYLKDENGQLVINEESLQKVIAARTEQMAVETALSYVQQIRSAIERNEITELMNLTLATEQTTTATWDLVYAQLRLLNVSGDLNDTMYAGALQNINNLRALSGIAISSIGKVEGSVKEANESAKKALKEQGDYLDDLLKYVMEMIKQEVKNQIDGIEKQIDNMKEIVDLQKKSLDLEREKDKYTKNVADKTKELAKLQQQLALLELDDSRESAAKQAKLKEEIADLSNNLADEQSDHAYDATSDMLDDMYDAYEKEKKKEIETLENTISSEEKVYRLAIERIQTQWDTLYQQLLDWNYEYGTVTNNEITAAWDAACVAVQKYGSYLEAVLQTQQQLAALEASSSSSSSTVIGGGVGTTGTPNVVGNTGNYDTSGKDTFAQANTIVEQMKQNSANWHGGDKTAFHNDNRNLAKQLETLLGWPIDFDEKSGTWYMRGKKLYDQFPIYHSGGIAGDDSTLKQDEVFAKLKKGEAVFTEEQQKPVYQALDFAETMLGKYGKVLSSISGSNLMGIRMQEQIKQDTQQAQTVVQNGSMSNEFNLTFPVQVLQKLSDNEIKDLTKKISNFTIKELDGVFALRGMRSLRR